MGILDRITGRKKDDAPKKDVNVEAAPKKEAPKTEVKAPEKKKAAPAKKPVTKTASKTETRASGILLRPRLTEKGHRLSESNQVVFEVAKHANKIMVREAVQNMFGVTPTSVRMLVQKGKAVRFKRMKGTRKDVKKAVVTLAKGDHIDLFESAN